MKLFKSGLDLNKVAKTLDTINLMLKEITPKIDNSYDNSQFAGEVFMVAYAFRKNVIDIIDDNNWGINVKIMVSSFESRRISLTDIYTKIYNSIIRISELTDCYSEVENILEKGNYYYEFESVLPKEVLESLK